MFCSFTALGPNWAHASTAEVSWAGDAVVCYDPANVNLADSPSAPARFGGTDVAFHRLARAFGYALVYLEYANVFLVDRTAANVSRLEMVDNLAAQRWRAPTTPAGRDQRPGRDSPRRLCSRIARGPAPLYFPDLSKTIGKS